MSESIPAMPDYPGLVQFLVAPLLDDPEQLKVSCEFSRGNQRALVRIAFDTEEQGRVLGRGGRNIEAIRVVLNTTALSAGQTVRLEVFDTQRSGRQSSAGSGRERRPPSDRRRSKYPDSPRKRSSPGEEWD